MTVFNEPRELPDFSEQNPNNAGWNENRNDAGCPIKSSGVKNQLGASCALPSSIKWL